MSNTTTLADRIAMSRPDAELRKKLASYILDPRTHADTGPRGSISEDNSVNEYNGRPRTASAKYAFNRKRVYGVKSKFDSLYT